MTRFAIATLVLVLGGCFQDHPAGQHELMGTDCYSCHTTDYANTTAPVHRDARLVAGFTVHDILHKPLDRDRLLASLARAGLRSHHQERT